MDTLTFQDVMQLREAANRASDRADALQDETEADWERAADAKLDAVDCVLARGADFDRFKVLALLVSEGHECRERAAELLGL